MSTYRKKLIEVSLPLEAINAASAKEKSIRQGHPSTLHLWWARRPLAAARAVLFSQLVDDPSSWTELFPTEEEQNCERQRLFRLIEDLVLWENTNNESVINAARLEIARSHARSSSSPKAKKVLAEGVKPEIVNEYLATELPPVHDPFAGGGTIPLEAQRLGLRSIASDLNPVAVLINKALIEVPPKFANRPPVNPDSRAREKLTTWRGAEGLAEDVRHYASWMRDQARERIGHLYPDVELGEEYGGGKATVIAWLWARTVESQDPSFRGCLVPLASTFLLSIKGGRKTWVHPVVEGRSYRFEIRSGIPAESDTVETGTKLARGANFKCILSGSPIEPDYIKAEAAAGRLGTRLMAIVAQAKKGRVFIAPSAATEVDIVSASALTRPDEELPKNPRWFSPPEYGMATYGQLFTERQLVAMEVLQSLLLEARERAIADAARAGLSTDLTPLREGGIGSAAYGDAVSLYLGLGLSKLADSQSSLVRWMPERDRVITTFSRQALPMIWDFAESNLFAEGSGDYATAVYNMMRVLPGLPAAMAAHGFARQHPAQDPGNLHDVIVATDPPYFDNVGYADLSDFFYIWLRKALRTIYPAETTTVLVPKDAELVATPYRHGGKAGAEKFFSEGMHQALQAIAASAHRDFVVTIYYAFKQSESDSGGSSSTGWAGFLEGLISTGFTVDGTWPIRTERAARSISIDTNALASSIVLVCRKRPVDAPTSTRGEFRRMLRKELPEALKKLQQGNIAPVDVAQASIGPGMAIFTRHKQVAEADGTPMTVRSALQLINEVLDEYLSSGEGDFDADTRFAITWYEQHGWDAGSFGDAESLAKARNVSVKGVEEAGICKSAAGKVRILKRSEMRPLDYDPAADERPTVWEFTQHLIRNLEEDGEEAAARLLKKLGSAADATRELAYRLYNTCERKKWTEDARSYNGLILAWTELDKLAARMGDEPAPAEASTKSVSAKKKPAKKASGTKGQQKLFEGDDK